MVSLKPLPFDSQLIAPLTVMGMIPAPPAPTREDIQLCREMVAPATTDEYVFKDPEIEHRDDQIPGLDGNTIDITVVQKKGRHPNLRTGIFYVHGGGMIMGNRKMMLETTFPWVKELDAVLVSPEYRLAPEHQHPAHLNDCWTALQWFSKNTKNLGIDPRRVIVAGHSAGGGLAAGIALMARDRKLKLKFCAQLLVYPMLDDRNETVSSKQFFDHGSWSGKGNVVAWEWYLGPKGKRETLEGLIYAAPARATDLSGLPPTLIEVGTAEPFRDEDIAYATKLLAAGVPTELHVYSGAFHGSDAFALDSDITKATLNMRMSWLKRTIRDAPSSVKIPSVL